MVKDALVLFEVEALECSDAFFEVVCCWWDVCVEGLFDVGEQLASFEGVGFRKPHVCDRFPRRVARVEVTVAPLRV